MVVRSRLSGADFSIGENGGTTATQLGIRSLTANTALADLNHGLGVTSITGADFTIHRKDGTDLPIDISSAVTIGDVLEPDQQRSGEFEPGHARRGPPGCLWQRHRTVRRQHRGNRHAEHQCPVQ